MSGGRYTSLQGSSGYGGGGVGSGPGYRYDNRPNGAGQIPPLMTAVNPGGLQSSINAGYGGSGRFHANVYSCHGGVAATGSGSGYPEYWRGSGGGYGVRGYGGYNGIGSGGGHLPGPGLFSGVDADGGCNVGNNNGFIRKTYGGGEANLQSKLQAMADSGSGGGARGGFDSRVGVSTQGGGRGGEADMKKFAAYQLNNKRRRDDGDCAGTQDHSVGVGGEGKRPRVERVKKEKPREGREPPLNIFIDHKFNIWNLPVQAQVLLVSNISQVSVDRLVINAIQCF